ncbi:MAG: PHP domain-containing protein [Candidatus Omnitrophota bacterium]|nr:PHP domain-containing protein [Candidatus Omnitrophota bacterium]
MQKNEIPNSNFQILPKICLKSCFIGIICLLCIVISSEVQAQEQYENVSSVIHVQSNISDGKLSIAEIVKLAKEKGIKVVVITDCALRRWEYGLAPFERIIRRKHEEDSVISFGVRKYFKEISDIQSRNPEILVIPGMEVAPFYYWKGSYLNNTLTLYNWHEKFLVLGLNNINDYRYLPIVGNYSLIPRNFRNLLDFWPMGLVALGFFLKRFRRKKHFSFAGQVYSDLTSPFRGLGIFLIFLGIVLCLGIFRFPISPYNQYRGNQGIKPYQYLIDYVTKRNGLIFWLRPETNYSSQFLGARVITLSYKDDLRKSFNYTGFAGIYFDNYTATNPQDLWDRLLNDYCEGRRKTPVWIFGEVGWDGTKETWHIDGIETVLLLKDFNQQAVLEALRQGRMYAKLNRQKNDFSLDKFCVMDETKEKIAFMGEDLKISKAPQILIKASFAKELTAQTSIKLIRDGEVIKEFNPKTNKIAINFKDNGYTAYKKSFYRLQIYKDECLILTNPIIVSSKD